MIIDEAKAESQSVFVSKNVRMFYCIMTYMVKINNTFHVL